MENLPSLNSIPIKDRVSFIFIEKGQLDVLDGSFVVVDVGGVRTHIPVGSVTCLMLEPGTRVSHAAMVLAERVGCLVLWVGEAGVRLYSAGQPGGARSDKLLYQASLALDESSRLKVVRKMYQMRFKEESPQNRSIEQLRGIEGIRVRKLYEHIAASFGIPWKRRDYDPNNWDTSDDINKALSSATSCLYGLSEAAILAAGYAPAIGFIHSGKPRSFVYDVADVFKFDTVIPIAFRVLKNKEKNIDRAVRLACRDAFRSSGLLKRIIPSIEEMLTAGCKKIIKYDGVVDVAFQDKERIGDDGHRS